ncbi:ParA family protein [Pseudanabaena mucicola]|uniref:ParA family protein n=1 Tax=Pseudanabaena mucicola FACHB-723 TaxID=2692860 RepID=A0ABR8A1S5_9CYAN|nr:ParA family protein [Pseudanabaena mucicola]MBD2189774.1 ParA family protein [Pseudanabaena mucicola FACHB-723]
MGKVIATVNMKGGVGKTTLTVNIATCLAKIHRKKVLVIDLDTQISATLSMISPAEFAKCRKENRTLRNLVSQAITRYGVQVTDPEERVYQIKDLAIPHVCKVQGLDLLVGDIDLYDEFLVSEMLYNRSLLYDQKQTFQQTWSKFEQTLIKGILEPAMKTYDFIILDCAPGYNLITRSSIIASDFYLMPARPEPLSVVGIQLLERRIEKLRDVYREDNSVNIQLLGIVFSMSTGFTLNRYYQKVMDRVSADFSAAKIFKTKIPNDVNIAKAVDTFIPVSISHPNSGGAKAFADVTSELLQKLEVSLGKKEQTSRLSLVDLE